MIDLHLHTKYSDGNKNLQELLEFLQNNKISYASVTDHNTIDAHLEYQNNNFKDLYKVKLIPGVELQVYENDILIEVLVYNFDIQKFKEYIQNNRKKFWEFHEIAYQKLLKKASEYGLKYREPNKEITNGYYANLKFQEALRNCYDENIHLVSHEFLTVIEEFYRKHFQNKDSFFYIDAHKQFPTLQEVIKKAHEVGGLVFLAHIDEYPTINDKTAYLNYLIKNYDFDGVEVYHPSINPEHTRKYKMIAEDNNLLISAGSDHHGNHLQNRQNINTPATLEEIFWLKDI